MVPPIDHLTEDGYDLQFGTNCLGTFGYLFCQPLALILTLRTHTGHFFFTKLLLPTLLSTARSLEGSEEKVRIVTTSSSTHMFHGPGFRWETLRDSPERTKLGTRLLYTQSKYVSWKFLFIFLRISLFFQNLTNDVEQGNVVLPPSLPADTGGTASSPFASTQET